MGRLAVAAVAVAAVAGLATHAAGHGLVVDPRQRGALETSFNFPTIDPTAPRDTWYVPKLLGDCDQLSYKTRGYWGIVMRGLHWKEWGGVRGNAACGMF